MTIYLVRHAKAGRRGEFADPDWLRPLTQAGQQQARGLLIQLHTAKFQHIVSSPYVRCMETVVPLASNHGLAIEPHEALAEESPLDVPMQLVSDHWETGAVFCSHGDIIPMILGQFRSQGTDLGAAPKCEKGSTWILEGHFDGLVSARYVAPPAPPNAS